MAISGDTAVIGAFYDDHAGGTDSGSAYVFGPGGGVVEPWYFVHITDPHVVNVWPRDWEIWTDALACIRAMGPGVSGAPAATIVRDSAVFDDESGPGV